MIRIRRLVLLAAALAAVGFALVALGAPREPSADPDGFGWFAYPPRVSTDGSVAHLTSAPAGPDPVMYVGMGLVATAFLLTAGLMTWWARNRPSFDQDH